MRKGVLTILPICLLAFSTFVNVGLPAHAQPIVKGPNADNIKFIQYSDENIALKATKSGDIDMYLYRLPLELVSEVRKDSALTVYDRDAGSFGLLFNPTTPNDKNVLNPFQLKEVRYAMNYLIDRDFVVGEILKGSATPMVDPFGISSPEYQDIADIVESFGFRHDPTLAEKMISDALERGGATRQDGKWTFNGNPITIKIFIRSDDPRRNSIGEALSSDLEKIGFKVEKIFGDLSRAQLDVYGSNPKDLKWQIYTEGYAGTGTFVAYNPAFPTQMYAPWFGNMPQGYTNNTLDEITQKLVNLNFTSKDERTDLVREAVTQGIQESVRIFIAQTKEPYVASSAVNGLVNDFGAGISSRFSLINAEVPSRNNLNVGVRQLSQGSWNNIAGFKDTYSLTIYSAIGDAATLYHPYLGTVIPVRENWTQISTKGPTDHLSVPADVQKWNPSAAKWEGVGSNELSKSEVTYNILYSKWHNGISMDKNDLLYSYYFAFEWGTNTTSAVNVDKTVDPEVTPLISAVLPIIKGLRFLSDDKVESYADIWHFDEKEIAGSATIWTTEPWEITAAQERVVTSGALSFSRTGAVEKGVDWLSLVNPQHVQLIKSELQKMKDERYVPPALKGLVNADQAAERYDASIKWITDHNNAVISNGPFYLDSFNPGGQTATIKAFRDNSYPFEQNHWSSKFGNPMLASIENVDTQGSLNIGQSKTIQVFVNVGNKPSNDAQVKYFIVTDKGVIAKGEANPSKDKPGQFAISLNSDKTSQFSPGASTLKIFAISNKAYKPVFYSTPLLAVAAAPSSVPGGNQNNNSGSGNQQGSSNTKSGCLIATAAFGSELTPQVEYLRNFREHYILATASGSAFMQTFNAIYYSFSPQVADYEREQPWLQQTVKLLLYPLFGILALSENAHDLVGGGETGAILAGATASALIGSVYIAPPMAAYTITRKTSSSSDVRLFRFLMIILGVSISATIVGSATNNHQLLPITTAIFVLSIALASAMGIGRLGASRLLRMKRTGEV